MLVYDEGVQEMVEIDFVLKDMKCLKDTLRQNKRNNFEDTRRRN